jgi:hypothetical protein
MKRGWDSYYCDICNLVKDVDDVRGVCFISETDFRLCDSRDTDKQHICVSCIFTIKAAPLRNYTAGSWGGE